MPQSGPMGGGGKGGGGGGGQQNTQQQNQYSALSPWAQPYVTSLLGAAQQQVFDTRATPSTAGTPAQYDEYGNQINAGTPGTPAGTEITGIHPYNAYGSYNPQGGQYGLTPSDQAAANAAVAGFTPLQQQAYQGASGLNLPNQFAPATGAALMGTGQALNAGQNYQNMATNPYAVGAYMNPYIQQSLQPQLNMIAQQGGIQGAQQQGAATQAGAFGGSRNALQQSLTQQNTLLAQQQAIAQGYNTAYQNAQQAQQFGANLGLQGSQTGIQGAGQLGNLGTSQLAAQQGILGLQNQFGGQQQQQNQNVINAGMTNYQTAMNYPMSQLQQLSNLASPYITKDVTTTQQQVQPSAATQLAGLGTAGVAGLALASKAAKGGLMETKNMASGGIAALNRKALLSPESIPQKSLNDGILNPQVSGIAKAIQLSDQVNAKNADALNKPPVQGTIMDELEAKASQMDQAEAMQDMIPKALAVLKHKMDMAIEEGDIPLAKKYAAELQQLTELVQQQAPEQSPSAPAPEGIQQVAPQVQQVADAGAPQQGIEAAPSNLPTQTMAEGGIVGYARGGSAKVLQDADEEAALAAEDAIGSGVDNDFIQSIMPAAEGRSPHPSAAISVRTEEGPIKGAKGTHKYEADVIKEAKRIGLPPEIAVHSLYKETGGLKDPESARSRAGALGVMQLMPATAKELGVNPLNPMENIQGGVGYLKKLYDKYQDPQLTLMAYNAGPGRVDRALKSNKGIESLPHETLAYRMAAGGVAHYDDGGLADARERRDAALKALSSSMPDIPSDYKGSLTDYLSDPERAAAYERNERDREIARKAILNNIPLPTIQRDILNPAPSIKANTPASSATSEKRIFPVAPVPMTSPTDAELGRASSAPSAPASPVTPSSTTETAPTPKSFMEQLAEEMAQDIKSRKEESKKTREQNNLLALMQAGLGMAASKNIAPLGAIGEGGMQGLSALAQYRKQEGEEAKDIGAQQLGLYRFGAAADQNKVLNQIREAQLGLKQTGAGEKAIQAARDDLAQFEKIRIAALAKRFPMGELDPKYKAALAEIYSDPKYKALEAIAFPSLAQSSSAVQSGDWSIKPKKG